VARIRSIKPEFPQSETIGALSRDARLLFIQLWTIVDDEGRARAASRMLASLLYPYDNDAPKLIDRWLDELEANQCLKRYEVEGAKYLEIVKWLKHQKIDHPTKSRLPEFAKPRENIAKSPEPLAPDLGPRTLDHGPRTVEGTKEEPREDALPPADDWPSDFRERFWSRYPNKVGRPAALKKLEIARKSGRVTWVTVMAGLEKYIAKTDDRPWCNPATWIQQDRWNDQPAQVQKTPMDAQKQRSDDALEQLRAFNRSRDEGGREAPRVLPQSDGERSADIHNGPGRIVAVLPAVCDRPTAEREGRAAGDLQVLSDHSGNQGNLRRLG
jgi:hypothetical protein